MLDTMVDIEAVQQTPLFRDMSSTRSVSYRWCSVAPVV